MLDLFVARLLWVKRELSQYLYEMLAFTLCYTFLVRYRKGDSNCIVCICETSVLQNEPNIASAGETSPPYIWDGLKNRDYGVLNNIFSNLFGRPTLLKITVVKISGGLPYKGKDVLFREAFKMQPGILKSSFLTNNRLYLAHFCLKFRNFWARYSIIRYSSSGQP